jgi:hypothetical protein
VLDRAANFGGDRHAWHYRRSGSKKLLAIIAEMADAGRLTAARAMVLPTAEVASIIDLEPLAMSDLTVAFRPMAPSMNLAWCR